MWVQILNEENFQSETSSGLVLVDFWAEWCGPCQMMLPILDQYASEAPAGVKVAKVNVDEAPSIAQSFRVMSIPTLIVLKDGKMVENMVGVKKQDELHAVISKYL